MSKILVLGGTTFVSRYLAIYLIEKGYDVDILTRGNKTPDYSGFRAHLKCDRHIKEQLLSALKSKCYEYVFDISGYTKDDVTFAIEALNTNTLKKYIFCSSGTVYKPESSPITENCERGENPYWGIYGTNKKAAEDFLMDQYNRTGFPVIIFRPTYIYGESNNLYREIYFFDRITNERVIPFPYGKNSLTQFIHIDDLVRAFESAIHSPAIGEAYNLTFPEIISWEKLIQNCSEIIGKDAKKKPIDVNKITNETRSYFPFRDIAYLLDITKLNQSGLYIPQIDLREGLKRAYKWYVKESPVLFDNRMNAVDII